MKALGQVHQRKNVESCLTCDPYIVITYIIITNIIIIMGMGGGASRYLTWCNSRDISVSQ